MAEASTWPGLSGPAGGSKSDQVRALLTAGMTGTEIAATVGCSPNLVYVVKSHLKSRRNARSWVVASPPPVPKPEPPETLTDARANLGVVLSALRALERERDALKRTLQQIRALLREL